MVTGRARSQSRPVRRLSTRVPASIASSTQVVGIRRSDTRPMVSASASIAPSESNQWQQTHSWTSPWESIQRAVALSVVSTKMQELLLACRLRSNVIRIRSNCAAAKSLSIWLSLGGMDGN